MSGDTQPRKRKDKKRRKEDEGSPFQPTVPIITNNNTSSEDVNIHVHKEDRLGGGICAKLVFFVLLSALAVLIGLIITEHRGLTEVDNVETSTNSKFSQIFEGWTDSNVDQHEHDNENILSEEHDDHDDDDDERDVDASEMENEDEDEHQEHDEDDEDNDEEERDRSVDDDEDETAENEDNEDEPDLTQEELSEEVDKDSAENDSNEIDDTKETEENDDDTQENYETEERSEEIDEKSAERDDEDDLENDEETDKDEDDDYFKDDKDEDDDDDGDKYNDEEKEDSAEENVSDERDNLDKSDEEVREQYLSKEKEDDDDFDNNDDDDERVVREAISREERSKEERTIGDDNAKVDDTDDQEEDGKPEIVNAQREPDDDIQESSGMAVRVGVGVALLVVAHLVLCRKWRSASDDKPNNTEDVKESTPDLSRRNTIIVPPTFQEVEQDIEHDEEDLSDEESPSDQEEPEPRTVKERYTELRSTYSRTLGPHGESLAEPINYEDDNDYDEEVEEEISEEEDEEDIEDEEDEDDNDEEYDEEDNEELLKRLDAKYGKLPGESSAGYVHKNLTNREDFKIKHDIDDAENTIEDNPAYAVKLFDKILEKFPSSPRSIYGKAVALNKLADLKRSNEILYKAIELYTKLLKSPDVPDALYKVAVEKAIKVMRFVGQYRNVIEIHKLAITRFSMVPSYYNELAVTYLTINRIAEAKAILNRVLEKWPGDGFALVHKGFILKTADNKLEEAVHYLRKGIATNDAGVIDGRFYFHLGDALERLGKHEEAMKVYEAGTKNKVFLSKYQRSLYNVARLTGKPFWDQNELPYLDLFRKLKQNWRKIREEGLSVLNEKGYFQDESENLRDKGVWKQFELFARGQKNTRNCDKTPITCDIIGKIPEAKGCKRGQTKFSVMHPGTHVWTHCGPTNCRLRVHLGLKVPPKTFLRVAQETRSWQEGEIIVFDDSFEHEVWHNGTEFRLVLIVDVWHPELTNIERRNLSPI